MTNFSEEWTVAAIARDVGRGARSAVAIMREALERARAYDNIQPQVWISRAPEAALLAQAAQIDARIAAGETLELAGVPLAVKDNIDVLGMMTTAACPAFAYSPRRSATVVEHLISAGGIVLGKTNLDQFATGLVGTRSPYGAVGCVFNRDFVSGGSSSGSAVVVAAGVVPLALGTDTAGSGRVPAAFNHLVGFKPTRGRWSTRGVVPACRSLDCVTCLTQSVGDAVLVDRVLASFDPDDPFARRVPAQAGSGRDAFKFGVPRARQVPELAPEDQRLYAVACAQMERIGGTPVEVDIAALLECARLLYGGPWVAERAAVVQDLLRTNPGAIHPVVRAIVQAGGSLTAVDAFRGLYAQQEFLRAAERIWEQLDILVLPTTPNIFRISELLAEPVALNAQLGQYTNFVNLLDMAAVAVPAGFRRNQTAAGVSLIGPAWSDSRLLEIAARYIASATFEVPSLDTQPHPTRMRLAVVGAHLSGMPLHWQLSSRAARLVTVTRTTAAYRLYAMNTTPAKPALVHVGVQGAAIETEVYELDAAEFGSFVNEVPAPLAIGTVQLADGSSVKGFVAEPRATVGALDITADGGWRHYLTRLATESPAPGAPI